MKVGCVPLLPVSDLVTDDRADGAEVDRGVHLRLKKRRLKYRRRKYDLVQHGMLVRVHLLRRHEPHRLIHRGVDAFERSFEFKPLRRENVCVVRRIRVDGDG